MALAVLFWSLSSLFFFFLFISIRADNNIIFITPIPRFE